MKALVFIFLFLTLRVNAHDHPSVHGMLVLGSEKIYLSHLPMFHSPHDYQVIMEVKLSEKAMRIYQETLKESVSKVFTLVPEVFVLPEMIQRPRPFRAQLFEGHFEREGKLIVDDLEVEILRVVYFKKFNPLESRPKFGQYLLFGNTQEQFLAHIITKRPDFDQILKLSKTVGMNQLGKIEFPTDDMTPISHSHVGNLVIDSQIYLERADLSF